MLGGKQTKHLFPCDTGELPAQESLAVLSGLFRRTRRIRMSEVIRRGIKRVFHDDFLDVSHQLLPLLFSHEAVGLVEFRDELKSFFAELRQMFGFASVHTSLHTSARCGVLLNPTLRNIRGTGGRRKFFTSELNYDEKLAL